MKEILPLPANGCLREAPNAGKLADMRAQSRHPRGDRGNVNFSPKAEIVSVSDPY
jgi:hypothetical protein